MYINSIGNALHRVFLPSEVLDLIREGLQLGLQQRAEEEHREQIWQRVLKARARVEARLKCKREFHPAILLFLTLYLAVGSEALPLILSYIIASLLLGLENLLGYLHVSAKITFATSRIVPTILLRPCKLLAGTPETPELVGVGWDLALACVLCPCC